MNSYSFWNTEYFEKIVWQREVKLPIFVFVLVNSCCRGEGIVCVAKKDGSDTYTSLSFISVSCSWDLAGEIQVDSTTHRWTFLSPPTASTGREQCHVSPYATGNDDDTWSWTKENEWVRNTNNNNNKGNGTGFMTYYFLQNTRTISVLCVHH